MTNKEMVVMASVAEQASRKAVVDVINKIWKDVEKKCYFSPGIVCRVIDAAWVFEILNRYKAESEGKTE